MKSALAGSEDHSRTLIEAAPAAVLEIDTHWRVISANPGLAELLGYGESNDLVGSDARELVSPEGRAQTETWLRDLVQSGKTLSLELEVLRKDAMRIPVQLSGAIVRGVAGAPDSAVLVLHDLSVRRRAEAAVSRARDYLTDVLNAVPSPIFVKDRQHRWILCNDAFVALIGSPRESLLGRSDYAFLLKEHADVFWAKDEEAFTTGAVNENEEIIETASKGRRTLLTRKRAFRDDTGAEVLVAVIADVTERKRAEEQLRLAAQVFEHCAQGILLTQPDHRIISVNRAFSRITGYASEEVVGRDARILGAARTEPVAWNEVWRGVSQCGSWEGVVINRSRGGQIYPAWLNVSAVRDDDARVVQYVTLLGDASERQARETSLRWIAQHDVLTDLPNRLLLIDRLRQALLQATRSGRPVAVMMLDLDRFKPVNDTHGHEAGDRVLREVARRLRSGMRESDTAARVGGDEFVLLLVDTDRAGAGTLAGKLIASIGEPFDLDTCQVSVGASIGIAVFPGDGADADALLAAADLAMYSAKSAGGHSHRYARQSSPNAAIAH